MKITITAEDIQFHARDFPEHHSRLEAAFHCDGVLCQAPAAPHEPIAPHFHLVFYAPDLHRERLVYVDPSSASREDASVSNEIEVVDVCTTG